MSLLMEALRKAEEAKRKGQQPRGDTPATDSESPGFSLVPVEPDSRHDPHSEDLPSVDEAEEDNPDTQAPHGEPAYDTDPEPAPEVPAPRKRVRVNPANSQSDAQLAAASVFAAKRQTTAHSAYLKPVLLSLAVLLPLIGGGLWYLLQGRNSGGVMFNPDLANVDLSNRSLNSSVTEPSEPLTSESTAPGSPATLDLDATNDLAAAASEAAPPASTPGEDAEPPEPTPVAEPEPTLASVTPEPEPPAPAAEATDQPAASPAPAATASNTTRNANGNDRLQVTRSREPAVVNATLQSAWNTLQAGDAGTAERLYAEVLAELPNNRDAILGLAVIHTQNGRLDAARRLYAQALTLNPQDPLARTGLLQTMAGTSSEIERELLSLRDNFPELAPIHFALGNLYAARQSWNDAQGAYFDAFVYASRSGNGPVSPDYAFNLAVSLEQLQQPRAALDYYRQAQTLAQERAPGFDPALLRSRLAFLEQNLP